MHVIRTFTRSRVYRDLVDWVFIVVFFAVLVVAMHVINEARAGYAVVVDEQGTVNVVEVTDVR